MTQFRCWSCGWRGNGVAFRACSWCMSRLLPDPDVSPPFAAGDVWVHPQFGRRECVDADNFSSFPIALQQGSFVTWWRAEHFAENGWTREPLSHRSGGHGPW